VRAQVCVLHPCSLFLEMCFVLRLFYFDNMFMRLPLSPWSIAKVPLSQALLGFLFPPPVTAPAVIGAHVRRQNKTKR